MSRPAPLAALAALALATTTTATTGRAAADELERRPNITVPIVLGGGALFILGETVLKDAVSPDECRWCGSNSLDRAVRDGLVWDNPKRANGLSNWTGFVAAPVVALGGIGLASLADDQGDQLVTDGLIVLESSILTSIFTNIVKGAAGRQRPELHYQATGDFLTAAPSQEDNLSFFSGHSSFTMSLAVSAGTVASLRGYRAAPYIWGAGVGLSLTTGYLRIAADRHWTTDVVTGWLVGAAFGVAVPLLHRTSSSSTAREGTSLAISPRLVMFTTSF